MSHTLYPPKTRDEWRLLLSDFAEGNLSSGDERALQKAMQEDAVLRDEYNAFKMTLTLLHDVAAPAAPLNMAAKVRAQLAQDGAVRNGDVENLLFTTSDSAAFVADSAVSGVVNEARRSFGFWALAAAAGFALILGGLFAAKPQSGASAQALSTAGVGGTQVSTRTFSVLGLSERAILQLAKNAGLKIIYSSSKEVKLEGAGEDAIYFCQKARLSAVKWQGLNPLRQGKVRLKILIRDE